MKVSIIVPAHNEEKRIERTLKTYITFFENVKKFKDLETRFIVVLNGCSDNTYEVVSKLQKQYNTIEILDKKKAGKGFAVIEGFKHALKEENDLIGFVDADMATLPKYFYDLILNINGADGIIASRYDKESKVTPQRPFIKSWGRKLIFNPLTRLMLGIRYTDFQCGAKLFKPRVLKKIVPHAQLTQWAFDIELLYLCKKYHFSVKEIPTTWHDQDDSKLRLFNSGIKMLGSIIKLRIRHSQTEKKLRKNK